MSGYIKGEWAKTFESKFKIQKDETNHLLKLQLNKDSEIAVNLPEENVYQKYRREVSHLQCENLLYQADYILMMKDIYDVLYYAAREDLIDIIYDSQIKLNISRLPSYFSSVSKTLNSHIELLELYELSVELKIVKLEALIILVNLLNDEVIKYCNNLNLCFYSYIVKEDSSKSSNSIKRTFEFLFDIPIEIYESKYSKNKEKFLNWVGRRKPIYIINDLHWSGHQEVFYDSEEDDLSEGEYVSNKRRK